MVPKHSKLRTINVIKTFQNIQRSIIYDSVVLYNPNMLKWPHDLVVSVSLGINEFVDV